MAVASGGPLPPAGAPGGGEAGGGGGHAARGVRAGLRELAASVAPAVAGAGAAAQLRRAADAVLLAPALDSGGGWLGVRAGERGALCAEGVAAAVLRLGGGGHAELGALLDALAEALLACPGGPEALSMLLALGGEGGAGLPARGSGAHERLRAGGCAALRAVGRAGPAGPVPSRGDAGGPVPAAACELEPELRLLGLGGGHGPLSPLGVGGDADRGRGDGPLLRSVKSIEGGVSALMALAGAPAGGLCLPDITEVFTSDQGHPLNPFRARAGGGAAEPAGPSGREGGTGFADGWTRILHRRGDVALSTGCVDAEVQLLRLRSGAMLTDGRHGAGEMMCSWCEVAEGRGGTAGGRTLPEEDFVREGYALLSGSSKPPGPRGGSLQGCRTASSTATSIASTMAEFARAGARRREVGRFCAHLDFDWGSAAAAAARDGGGFPREGGGGRDGVQCAFLGALKQMLRQYDDSLRQVRAAALDRRQAEDGGVRGGDLRPVTLLELLFHTEELRSHLAWLAAACWCDPPEEDADAPEAPDGGAPRARWEREAFPRGPALLDMLYQEAVGADAGGGELLQYLFQAALEPYFSDLTRWLFFGRGCGGSAGPGAGQVEAGVESEGGVAVPDFLGGLREQVALTGQQLRVLHLVPGAVPFVRFLETLASGGEDDRGRRGGADPADPRAVEGSGGLPKSYSAGEVFRFRSFQKGQAASVSAAAGRLLESMALRRAREADEASEYLRYVQRQRASLLEAARVAELEALAASRARREQYGRELQAVISERRAAAEEARAGAIAAERAALDAAERGEVSQLKADIEQAKSRLEATKSAVRKNIQRMRWQRRRLELSASRRSHESRLALEERIEAGSSPVRALDLAQDDGADDVAANEGIGAHEVEAGGTPREKEGTDDHSEGEGPREGAPGASLPPGSVEAGPPAGTDPAGSPAGRTKDESAEGAAPGGAGRHEEPRAESKSLPAPSAGAAAGAGGAEVSPVGGGSGNRGPPLAIPPASPEGRPSSDGSRGAPPGSPASPLEAPGSPGATEDDRYTMQIFQAADAGQAPGASEPGEPLGAPTGDQESPSAGVPLPVVVDACIVATVRDHYAAVSGLTVRIFLDELRLLDQLDFLRGAFFLCDGEFARTLVERLDRHHSEGLALNNWQLEDMLGDALRSSSLGASRYGGRLELRLNALLRDGDGGRPGGAGSVREALGTLELAYRCEEPLAAVLTARAMGEYNRGFRALLQLRWARAALSEAWERMRLLEGRFRAWRAGGRGADARALEEEAAGADGAWDAGAVPGWADTPESERRELLRRLHRLELFRHEMNHFVAALEGFVLGQLEGGAREGLRRGLAAARDLRGVARAHGAYVSAALRCCFLGAEFRAASDFVAAILQRAVDLQALCRAHPGLSLARGETPWRKVQALHLSFKNTAHLLFRLLRAARHPQLAELGLLLDPTAFYGFPASAA